MNKRVSYSDILLEFIAPLLTGQETEQEIWEKAKAGQMAWNFVVSDQAKIKGDDYVKAVFKQITSAYPEAKEVLDPLVIRKHQHFSQYDQYILIVETRRKTPDEIVLHVESAPAFALPKMK